MNKTLASKWRGEWLSRSFADIIDSTEDVSEPKALSELDVMTNGLASQALLALSTMDEILATKMVFPSRSHINSFVLNMSCFYNKPRPSPAFTAAGLKKSLSVSQLFHMFMGKERNCRRWSWRKQIHPSFTSRFCHIFMVPIHATSTNISAAPSAMAVIRVAIPEWLAHHVSPLNASGFEIWRPNWQAPTSNLERLNCPTGHKI